MAYSHPANYSAAPLRRLPLTLTSFVGEVKYQFTSRPWGSAKPCDEGRYGLPASGSGRVRAAVQVGSMEQVDDSAKGHRVCAARLFRVSAPWAHQLLAGLSSLQGRAGQGSAGQGRAVRVRAGQGGAVRGRARQRGAEQGSLVRELAPM